MVKKNPTTHVSESRIWKGIVGFARFFTSEQGVDKGCESGIAGCHDEDA